MGQVEFDQRKKEAEIYELLVEAGLRYVLPKLTEAILGLEDPATIAVIKETVTNLLFESPSFPTRQELDNIAIRIAKCPDELAQKAYCPDELAQNMINLFWEAWVGLDKKKSTASFLS